MLRTLSLILLTLLAPVTSATGPIEDLFYKGRAIPFYGKAITPEQEAILNKFKETHLAESLAGTVQGTVRLKRDLGVGFTSCGRPNAFYSPKRSTITFCLEMIELILKQVDADPDPSVANNLATKQKIVVGAVYGLFLHELGHAVLDINHVPITGREEDVADQFSLYYATKIVEPQGVVVVLPTVWFFHALESRHDMTSDEVVKRVMSDEHSLDAQRSYNLACWALGANPQTGARVAAYVKLPETRRVRCVSEYARIDDAMRRLFGKYLVVKAR